MQTPAGSIASEGAGPLQASYATGQLSAMRHSGAMAIAFVTIQGAVRSHRLGDRRELMWPFTRRSREAAIRGWLLG